MLLIATLCGAASRAGNPITNGAVELTPGIYSIGVRHAFSGDDNANSSWTVQIRKSSDSAWRDFTGGYVDRRATIAAPTSGSYANPHPNQGRINLVGLLSGTSYDVKTAWSDSDGGSATVTNTITTLPAVVPQTNGVVKYLDSSAAGGGDGSPGNPWNSFSAAISGMSNGDTVEVAAGTNYGSFTISSSGTASAWKVFRAATNGAPKILSGANAALTVSANFVAFIGFDFKDGANDSVRISSGQHDVWLSDGFCTNAVSGTVDYGDSAIRIFSTGASSNISIVRMTLRRPDSAAITEAFGIYFQGSGERRGIVVSNIVEGGFRDGLAGESEGDVSHFDDFEVIGNTWLNITDDAMEIEGHAVNARVIGNTVRGSKRSDGDAAGFGNAGVSVGPTVFARNAMHQTNNWGIKKGNGGVGPVFWYHNTLWATGSKDIWSRLGDVPGYNSRGTNNAVIYDRYAHYREGATAPAGQADAYDYNGYYDLDGSSFADEYGASQNETYNSLSAWISGTGHDANSVSGNPSISSSTFLYPTNSVFAQEGVTLAGYNDADSGPDGAWAARGAGPDMGAFEVDPESSDTTPPVISALSTNTIRGTSFSVSWTTDEPATRGFEWGTNASYTAGSLTNSTPATDHAFFTGSGRLPPEMRIFFRVWSSDTNGNTSFATNSVLLTKRQILVVPDSTMDTAIPDSMNSWSNRVLAEDRFLMIWSEATRTSLTATNREALVQAVRGLIASNRPDGAQFIGHAAWPKSGWVNIDGHDPRAVYAPIIYAMDPEVSLPDSTDFGTYSSDTNLSNHPGDGAYDIQTLSPSQLQLPVAWIDFGFLGGGLGDLVTTGCLTGEFELPSVVETNALNDYFARNLAYRQGTWSVTPSGNFQGTLWASGGGLQDDYESQMAYVQWIDTSDTAPGAGTNFFWFNNSLPIGERWRTFNASCVPSESFWRNTYRSFGFDRSQAGAPQLRWLQHSKVSTWGPDRWFAKAAHETVYDAVWDSMTNSAIGVYSYVMGDLTLPILTVSAPADGSALVTPKATFGRILLN